jgi:hypothetical protein
MVLVQIVISSDDDVVIPMAFWGSVVQSSIDDPSQRIYKYSILSV